MTATGQNLVSIEPKGTLDVQTSEERARFSDVWHVCPLPVFNIKSNGFNPIGRLSDTQPNFRARLYSTAAACVDPEPGVGQFFASSAEDIIATLAGWIVVQARANGRVPYFPAVWSLVTEPDRFQGKQLIGGFTHTMKRIAENHHRCWRRWPAASCGSTVRMSWRGRCRRRSSISAPWANPP